MTPNNHENQPKECKKLEQRSKKTSAQHQNKTISRAFWITILAMAFGTIALALVGSLGSPRTERTSSGANSSESSQAPLELPSTALERLLSEAAKQSLDQVAPRIDAILDNVYAPVYAAIPAYASFHYSIPGEYIELTGAALGKMNMALNDKLFVGFGERLRWGATLLDEEYAAAYNKALQTGIGKAIPSDATNVPLGPVTRAALQNARNRAKISVPLASAAATAVGSGALTAVTAIISKKLTVKIAAKAVAKSAAKGSGIITGAGGGALLCSWSGPGAALCGVVGGVAAWFLTDAVIVNLDEYFNRDEFEAELRQLIDEDRAAKKRLFETTLKDKADEMNAAAKDFMLRDLGKTLPKEP